MIERASMDGTGRMLIHTFNVTVTDIALDDSTQTLYWTSNNNIIESSDIEGSNRRVIDSSIYGQSVDFLGDNLYVMYYGSLIAIPTVMPNDTQMYYDYFSSCGGNRDIKVVSKERQTLSNHN